MAFDDLMNPMLGALLGIGQQTDDGSFNAVPKVAIPRTSGMSSPNYRDMRIASYGQRGIPRSGGSYGDPNNLNNYADALTQNPFFNQGFMGRHHAVAQGIMGALLGAAPAASGENAISSGLSGYTALAGVPMRAEQRDFQNQYGEMQYRDMQAQMQLRQAQAKKALNAPPEKPEKFKYGAVPAGYRIDDEGNASKIPGLPESAYGADATKPTDHERDVADVMSAHPHWSRGRAVEHLRKLDRPVTGSEAGWSLGEIDGKTVRVNARTGEVAPVKLPEGVTHIDKSGVARTSDYKRADEDATKLDSKDTQDRIWMDLYMGGKGTGPGGDVTQQDLKNETDRQKKSIYDKVDAKYASKAESPASPPRKTGRTPEQPASRPLPKSLTRAQVEQAARENHLTYDQAKQDAVSRGIAVQE